MSAGEGTTASGEHIGRCRWAIAEGWLPPHEGDGGLDRAHVSHEAACLLNTGPAEAHVVLTVYFRDREPCGPYRVTVPPRRTLHLRFDDLADPAPIPRGTDYSTVIESDVPIVVQYTRLDARHAGALLGTVAFPA